LEDVLYVPSADNNLLSIGRVDAKGGIFTAKGGHAQITDHDGQLIFTGKSANRMYLLD
ncbi:hypothetical protein K435DRAFT_602109, partial [Dendrothele bispora CBS 962.96]